VFAVSACAGYHMQTSMKKVPFGSVVPTPVSDIRAAEKARKEQLRRAAEEKKKKEILKKIRPLGPLKKKIKKELKGKEGEWSVYVKNLTSGDSFSVNNRPSRSASIIKLYTAGAYLKALKNKEINDTPDNAYDFEYMIKESSNDSWKALEARLAQAYGTSQENVVNDFAQSEGYHQTYRDRYSAHGSTTSVKDTGRLLEKAYKGKFVSKKASARLIKYMKMQDHRAKIPKGLPEKGVVCANKTGELDTVDNDAAIIWTKYQDYILVVMAEDVNKTMLAVPEINKISEMVYKYIVKI
jgi:beta-lactamase class A